MYDLAKVFDYRANTGVMKSLEIYTDVWKALSYHVNDMESLLLTSCWWWEKNNALMTQKPNICAAQHSRSGVSQSPKLLSRSTTE